MTSCVTLLGRGVDLKLWAVKPVVIEPIESPSSRLDHSGLIAKSGRSRAWQRLRALEHR